MHGFIFSTNNYIFVVENICKLSWYTPSQYSINHSILHNPHGSHYKQTNITDESHQHFPRRYLLEWNSRKTRIDNLRQRGIYFKGGGILRWREGCTRTGQGEVHAKGIFGKLAKFAFRPPLLDRNGPSWAFRPRFTEYWSFSLQDIKWIGLSCPQILRFETSRTRGRVVFTWRVRLG